MKLIEQTRPDVAGMGEWHTIPKVDPSELEFSFAIQVDPKFVLNLVFEACENRRVVHLARHAKKRRIRKKNARRAYCIVFQELVR